MFKRISNQFIMWAMVACIALSVYLRATLFHMGFEFDELFTAVTTNPDLPFEWITKHWLVVDVHPPLYNLLIWGWNHFVPYGPELWLRLPSFILGISVLGIAWAEFPKRFGKTVRLVFTSLLGCNLFVMGYSQHARAYMLVLLFAVPFTFMLLQFAHSMCKQRAISRREWIDYGLVALLLCWSHYFGALLFGVCSVVLFIQALRYKQSVKPLLIVSIGVVVLFLPWLVPNLQAQFAYHRFTGNWWANATPYGYGFLIFGLAWMGSWQGAVLMGLVLAGCVADRYFLHHGPRLFYWPRECAVLGATAIIFLLCISVASLKMFLFINRYFICLMPVLDFMLALFVAPRLRNNGWLGAILVLFLLSNMLNFWQQRTKLLEKTTLKMPARTVSRMFQNEFAGKEMFVVAIEAFPPAVMPYLYGFYVNKVYHLNIPVTELFALDEQARNKALQRQSAAVIWMPNCTSKKLEKLASDWQRDIYVTKRFGTVCFLQTGPSKQTP